MGSPAKPVSDRVGIFACIALAVLCLVGGVHRARQLTTLKSEGLKTAAVVDGIYRGAKGLKSAQLRFTPRAGTEIVARDILPMMLFRFKKGEQVTVIYHPPNPRLVTIDLGIWIWLQPAIFFTGAVVLITLALVLPRMSRRTDIGGGP